MSMHTKGVGRVWGADASLHNLILRTILPLHLPASHSSPPLSQSPPQTFPDPGLRVVMTAEKADHVEKAVAKFCSTVIKVSKETTESVAAQSGAHCTVVLLALQNVCTAGCIAAST